MPAPRLTGTDRDTLLTDLRRRYEAGATIRDLAATTGRSLSGIHRILHQAGTHMRPPFARATAAPRKTRR